MKNHILVLLGLSLLIVPYQNCSNPISFTNEEIANAELLAEDESDLPNLLPNEPNPPEDQANGDEKEDNPIEIPPIEREPIKPPAGCGKFFAVYSTNDKGDKKAELGIIKAFSNLDMSAEENYGYHGFSAHPVVGPTISGKNTKIFLLESSDGLNLNIIFNQDNGGSKKNHIAWKVNIDDNKLQDTVLFMDDPKHKEDKIKRAEINKHESRYVMNFGYYSNTDGVILGPLRDTARIKVNPAHSGEAGLGSVIIGPNGAIKLPARNKKGELEKFMLVGLDDMNCTQ